MLTDLLLASCLQESTEGISMNNLAVQMEQNSSTQATEYREVFQHPPSKDGSDRWNVAYEESYSEKIFKQRRQIQVK